MDEVDAAAAVLAVSVDDFAEEDLEQDARPASFTDPDDQTSAVEPMDVGKENKARTPAVCEVGAANPQVMKATPLPCSKRCDPPLISPDSHTDVMRLCPVPQLAVPVLLQKVLGMFLEGQGAPKAMPKDSNATEMTNELLVNSKEAIEELWKQRGYDSKKPDATKARLGYALDKEEAVGYLVTGALHLPRLAPDEARTIGKRIISLIGPSGPIGSKLKALRKRGKAAAPQIAALLQAASTLNLELPRRKSPAPSAAISPPPPPPPPPQPAVLPAPPPQQYSMHEYTSDIAPPAGYIPPPLPPPPPSARKQIRRIFGSREAAEAIYACREIEIAQDSLARDLADVGHPMRAELIEISQRDLANAKDEYARALLALKVAFPMLACCDAFETGRCAHGKTCECGSQQAPWPWIAQGANGAFCNCHMDTRRAWMKPAGMRYWQ
jgi:hypothetical protein